MPGTDTFALVDRIFDGNLAEQFKTWRTAGLTVAEITFRLRTEHDITVSHSTVWRWMRRIEGDAA